MSSSTSPPASSGTLNHPASSPTTSHNSIESINSKEQDLPRPTPTNQDHQLTSTSPPTNPSAVTDFSPQQADSQPLPSLSTTHPLSGSYPPPPSATASPAKPIDKHAADSAAREAKAHIRSLLREDWEWPSPTGQPECNAIDWRERDSDDEPLPSSPPDPDDNTATDNGSKTSRKRKRHTLLQEELHWNDGLRLWHQRRDCWAGARNTGVDPASSSPSSSSPSPSSPSPSPSSPTLPTSAPPPPPSLLPIAPPLLPPTNPIRQSISHATYPAIYSKIVIQGLSPTVPINLADMVGACVMGWKKDGEWPPKPTQVEDGDDGAAAHRGRGRRLARKGVGRVKRVLGLGHGDAEAEAEVEG